MKKLVDAGLVEREQRGKWAYFSLKRDAVEKLAGSRRPERSVLLMTTTTADELREEVRRRYAESALAVTSGEANAGCGSGSCCGDDGTARSARRSTRPTSGASCPRPRRSPSLGCGNPTAVADLREGETVLDLGSGGGIDVILSAKRVGPTGTRLRARHDRRDARAGAAERAPRRGSGTRSSSRA